MKTHCIFDCHMSLQIVFQATMQVPVHQALACRLEAYNSPFANASLQAGAELTEDDKQFAACLAGPPDLEEVQSFSIQRLASLLGPRPAPSLVATR